MNKFSKLVEVPVYIYADFKDYCEDCRMPDLYFKRDTAYADNEKFVAHHTIKCRNEHFCEQIKENLERMMKNDKE